MVDDDSWYSVVDDGLLFQGDIVADCPLATVEGIDVKAPENSEPTVDINLARVIVLSQSCDLENDKVVEVLVAEAPDWEAAVEELVAQDHQAAKSRKFRESLRDGNVPSLSLLHKHEAQPSMPWAVANFRSLRVVPKKLLSEVVGNSGPRLRMKSPYREHLAQAFARYFMRVGLPHHAGAFVSEGNSKRSSD